MSAEAFYRYYDLLYSQKDYAAESRFVLDLLRERAGSPVRDIVDIGCGTGRHAGEFAAAGVAVHGIDIESDAIVIANEANASPNLSFLCGTIAKVTRADFDGAVSLFNVVNYLLDDDTLATTFHEIARRLRPGSPFVFDSWNGVAAIADPPREKISEIAHDGKNARVTLKPSAIEERRYVTLTMEVDVTAANGTIDSFTCSYRHRLWTPDELLSALLSAGFRDVRLTRWMSNEPASDSDWKIMFSSVKE